MKRLAFTLAAFTAVVVACSSSSDDSGTPTDTPDSGASSSGSSGASSSGSSGTSSGSSGEADASPMDASDAADANSGPFKITSTAFTEGSAIPLAQAANCTNGGGMKINGSNESPPLAWTNGPAGTMSYVMEVHDASNMLVHAVTYDIPATVNALPGKMPIGNAQTDFMPNPPGGTTKQAKNISNTFGYAGPCPPNEHTYEFILYAVDVATLPGTTMNTSKEDIVTAAKAHMLATTKLTGTFTP